MLKKFQKILGFSKKCNLDEVSNSKVKFVIKKLIRTIKNYKAYYQELSILEDELKFLIFSYKNIPPVKSLEKICWHLKEYSLYSAIVKQLYNYVQQDLEALKNKKPLHIGPGIYLAE
ncbi:hypothetical protein [Adhaeribacter aquaticus]|uniref:hypothetical protein n=1 Tax=Adhaeribacter aquaticus TaxID=299567 RepID=UPI00040A5EEE|nr:hypothetical protein [Adhaeribacter aquaticus]